MPTSRWLDRPRPEVASRGLAAAASSAEVDSGLAGSRHDKRACDSSHNLSSVAIRNIPKGPAAAVRQGLVETFNDVCVFDSPVNIRAVVAGATEAHTIAGFCDTQAMLSFQVIHRFFTLDWR